MDGSRNPEGVERGALSIDAFCSWAGISRASFYRIAGQGGIPVRKIGRRSVVTMADANAWLASLPSATIAEAA